MDMSKMKKLKMHLTEALACLEGDDGEDEGSAAPEMGESEDDDVAMSSLKMKMGKYK